MGRRSPIPRRALPSPVVPSWAGFYLGIEGGGVFGASNQIDNGPFGFGPTTPGYNAAGALAGGTVGYNWQAANWVFGLESDIAWANIHGGAHDQDRRRYEGEVAGDGPRPPWLVHGEQLSVLCQWRRGSSFRQGGHHGGRGFDPYRCSDPLGGAFGVGAEAKLTSNWSFKAEYLYVKFQSASYFREPLPDRTRGCRDTPTEWHLFADRTMTIG
jgi:outer membrane immunogenic protein